MPVLTSQVIAEPVSASCRLRLVWQNPSTRQFIEVGTLDSLGDQNEYVFQYSDAARAAGFVPLVEFPDLKATYTSSTLPAFFANRVMSTRRRSYRDYLAWLGLSDVPTPMEVLARSGGGRATDTFHVVDSFAEVAGRRQGRFFASGLSHVDGVGERLLRLRPGQPLYLEDEPGNPVNRLAIRLSVDADEPVGWVPDWLVDDVHSMRDTQLSVTVSVDQVNVEAPDHLKLLCLLEALGAVPSLP